MLACTIGTLFRKKQRHSASDSVTPFQAVSTALAATIGTGSIAGIAAAIVSGGPGAIFWMWVSAALGAATKYCEIYLAVRYREKGKNGQWVGGPMYYMKNGLGNNRLASLFALATMVACFGTGNALQSNSIAGALESSAIHVDKTLTGAILFVIVTLVIIGGMKRISVINERLVPFMAIFYIGCAIVAVGINFRMIPEVFALIFREAFRAQSVAGGIGGYGILTAMRSGFSKGLLSNEAGLGSAPIAHAAANTDNPAEHALWGIFEVFFTTIVICTLTAVVVLTSGLWQTSALNGSALSIASFDAIIPGSGNFVVTTSTILFALSSILGWAYYGEVATQFLAKGSKIAVFFYRIIYVAVVYAGAVTSLEAVWTFSEVMNSFMAITNILALAALGSKISRGTKTG